MIFPLKNKFKIIFAASLIIAGAGLILNIALKAGSAEEVCEPIWSFDYRDTFFDIKYLGPGRGVIAGSRGRVLVSHSEYNNLWSPRDSGTKETLTGISFVDEKNGWAAGHGGIVIHTSDGGNTWKTLRHSSPQNQPLLDIKFVSLEVGYACGGYDTIIKTTDGGKTWIRLTTGTDYIFNGLDFSNEYTGYLVGEFGTILKTVDGGRTWNRQNIGNYRGTILGVTIISNSKILAYGIKGKLVVSTDSGQSWFNINSGIKDSLFRAAFDGKRVVIVGRSGVILQSRDGGFNYIAEVDKDFTSFAGVCVNPDGGFTGVGERGKIYKIELLSNE